MPALPRVLTAVLLALLATATACADDDDDALRPQPNQEPPEAGDPPLADSAEAERAMERHVLDLVNQEREERGLDPLEWDDQLADLARQWSQRMADEDSLEHQDGQRMLERSEGFNGVGENIYMATGPAPVSTVHVEWMRSDGHRANVLHPQFDRLGIGFVCGEDGEVWATQRFGSTGAPGSMPSEGDVPPQEPIVAEEGEGPRCPSPG